MKGMMESTGFGNTGWVTVIVTLAAVAGALLLMGCGPSAQPAAPAPPAEAAGSQVSSEEMRAMIEEAVGQSGGGSSGVTSEELEQVVASAVSEAMAEQQAMPPADSTPQEPDSITLTDVAGRT